MISPASWPGLRALGFAESLGSMRFAEVAWGLCLALPLACGASGIHFDGTASSRLLEPRDLAVSDLPPAGHEKIGEIGAECARAKPAGQLERERLSDLSCSRDLLLAALRERAAEVGGTALVALDCDAGGDLSCEADVYRPEVGAPRPVASERPLNEDPEGPAALGGPPRGRTADAWRVVVSSWSRGAARARKPVQQVEELAVPRAGQVVLADLKAYCASGCAEASVRAALTTAAARVGGSAVAAARCIRQGAAVECIASAVAPEQEEERPRLSEAP